MKKTVENKTTIIISQTELKEIVRSYLISFDIIDENTNITEINFDNFNNPSIDDDYIEPVIRVVANEKVLIVDKKIPL
jgi:hypothetical protein